MFLAAFFSILSALHYLIYRKMMYNEIFEIKKRSVHEEERKSIEDLNKSLIKESKKEPLVRNQSDLLENQTNVLDPNPSLDLLKANTDAKSNKKLSISSSSLSSTNKKSDKSSEDETVFDKRNFK